MPSSKSSPASFDVKQNGSQLLVQCSDVTETEIHVKVRELRKPSNRKFIGSGYKVYILEVSKGDQVSCSSLFSNKLFHVAGARINAFH